MGGFKRWGERVKKSVFRIFYFFQVAVSITWLPKSTMLRIIVISTMIIQIAFGFGMLTDLNSDFMAQTNNEPVVMFSEFPTLQSIQAYQQQQPQLFNNQLPLGNLLFRTGGAGIGVPQQPNQPEQPILIATPAEPALPPVANVNPLPNIFAQKYVDTTNAAQANSLWNTRFVVLDDRKAF